jgi:hypothetical protein
VVAVMVVGDMNGGLCIEQAFDTMIDICVRWGRGSSLIKVNKVIYVRGEILILAVSIAAYTIEVATFRVLLSWFIWKLCEYGLNKFQ